MQTFMLKVLPDQSI